MLTREHYDTIVLNLIDEVKEGKNIWFASRIELFSSDEISFSVKSKVCYRNYHISVPRWFFLGPLNKLFIELFLTEDIDRVPLKASGQLIRQLHKEVLRYMKNEEKRRLEKLEKENEDKVKAILKGIT